jgi:ABC-type branched-subunit amino acid transport system substrate-binding protein
LWEKFNLYFKMMWSRDMPSLRLLRRVFFIGFLFLTLPTLAQASAFTIGVLDNERGPVSSGARLAVQEINAAGGVRGADGTFFRLELLIQPTNFGENLPEAVDLLRANGVIAVLGPQTDSEVLNGLPTLQSLGVPVLTPATGDTITASDTSGYIFRSRSAEILQGQALASYLINELGLTDIATVQLDVDSTAEVIGFTAAAESFGITPSPALLLQGEVNDLAAEIIEANPQIVVTYGSPALASTLYSTLRQFDWASLFAYDQINDPNFTASLALSDLNGILSTTTWSFTSRDEISDTFLNNFVRTFGYVPDAVEAAAYDSVYLLAAAIGEAGELPENLPALNNVIGVQGVLRPSQLSRGETSNNVAIVQLGAFGAPEVVARYAGGVLLPPDVPPTDTAAATPRPTSTPDGVTITILAQPFQNVRSGPGRDYSVIGQLPEGSQARVIGANAQNTWVVIDFRGQQGWLSVPLLEVFGDLNTVPIINPPPLPTVAVTATPSVAPEADVRIDSVAAVPQPIVPNQPFTVSVIVRNGGNTNAGPFSVGATFPPNNIFTSVAVPGLAAGQTTTVNLTGTLTSTGYYTTVITADLNNQVAEGIGEGNNNFNFSYTVDRPIIRQTSQTLNAGDTLDLEGNGVQGDVNWNANGGQLDALFGARLGIIPNVTLESLHWDLINPSIVNRTTIMRAGEMNAGLIIGVITADGNRGAIRIDDIPGNQFVITFRAYQG